MSEKKQLSEKAAKILTLIANGHTYEQILKQNSDYTYMDIFSAAGEAVFKFQRQEKATLTAQERIEKARRKYPRAYETWTETEEKEVAALFNQGLPVPEIAAKFQRQRGAIESRLKKLGLIE